MWGKKKDDSSLLLKRADDVLKIKKRRIVNRANRKVREPENSERENLPSQNENQLHRRFWGE